jgi:hypothetical protein
MQQVDAHPWPDEHPGMGRLLQVIFRRQPGDAEGADRGPVLRDAISREAKEMAFPADDPAGRLRDPPIVRDNRAAAVLRPELRYRLGHVQPRL